MCALISLFYGMLTCLCIRPGVQATPLLLTLGLAAFFIGQIGNLYHHILLRNVRTSNQTSRSKAYVVPAGGLFEYVACPHYLCEIIAWSGVALVAPSIHTTLVALWVLSMLSGRSAATSDWYRARFGSAYPSKRRNLIPGVF